MKGRDRKAKARRCGNDMSVTKIRGWPCACRSRQRLGFHRLRRCGGRALPAPLVLVARPCPVRLPIHSAAPPGRRPRRTIGGPAPPGRRQAIVHAMPTGPFHFTGLSAGSRGMSGGTRLEPRSQRRADQERAGRARRRGGDRRRVDGGLVRASRGDPGLGGVPAGATALRRARPVWRAREDEAVGPRPPTPAAGRKTPRRPTPLRLQRAASLARPCPRRMPTASTDAGHTRMISMTTCGTRLGFDQAVVSMPETLPSAPNPVTHGPVLLDTSMRVRP